MKAGLEFVGTGTVVWVLFASLAVAIFFSRRVRREIKKQGKPLDLREAMSLFNDSGYFRSDIYGAFVSWIGCAAMIVALVLPWFRKF